MASAVLVAPQIPLDSSIVLNPNNAGHPLVREYMASKGSSVQVTKDGRRVRLESGNSSEHDVYNGFHAFLQQNNVDISNPNALDVGPAVTIPVPVDPEARKKRVEIDKLRAALEQKDWDIPTVSQVPEAIATAAPLVAQDAERGSDSKTDKLKVGMLTLFTIFRETASFVNINAVSAVRRAMYDSYLRAVNPLINWAFGEIRKEDGYGLASDSVLKESAQPKQSLVVQAPNPADPRSTAQVLFSRAVGKSTAKNSATTIMSFTSRIMMVNNQNEAAAAKANARARTQNNLKPRVN